MTINDDEQANGHGDVKKLVPLNSELTLDAVAIEHLEELLIAAKAGRVSALIMIAKENGYARWTVVRAYTQDDRYNMIGQIECVKQHLVDME